MARLLTTNNLSKAFGGLRAVSNFNIVLHKGELVGLIGPNGAGKTTCFNLLTGVCEPTEGEIIFDGKAVAGLKPFQITRRGIARTFQNIRLFADLTVLDNVKIACHFHAKYGFIDAFIRSPRYFAGEREIEEQALNYLEIFQLQDKKEEKARNLPYGEQRRLEIARALAAQPKLLLLDEPAAGMNPQETRQLMDMIRWIRAKFALTILLIEHDMSMVMSVCERIYVLDYGTIIAQGTPEQIRNNPRVIEAYLGTEEVFRHADN